MIDNVIETTENCRYCLMCRHVCPVGHVTRKETLTPHGWGLTIASIQRGMLELTEETVSVIYSCADCGTCRANCVTDQPLPSAIAAMRARIISEGLAPDSASQVSDRLRQWGNPHVEKKPENPTGTGQTALFVGDDAKYLDEETLISALTLLRRAGVDPILIGIGRNNGYLASSLGYPELAAELIKQTRTELEHSGAQTMLVLSPGDYYAFGQMSEERFGINWPEDVTLLELTIFLSQQLAEGKFDLSAKPGGMPFAYVDPTHSVRVQGRFEAPRKLLAAVMGRPGKELFWRKERTHPSGNVALQYTNPHISNHLSYARLGDARQSGVQLLISEDAGTLHHLRKHAPRFGLDIQNLYKLLADGLAE